MNRCLVFVLCMYDIHIYIYDYAEKAVCHIIHGSEISTVIRWIRQHVSRRRRSFWKSRVLKGEW